MFKRRMDVEEGFMVGQFGDQYREYMKRTASQTQKMVASGNI